MIFPTIRFAIFFAIVLPLSWLLMPVHDARPARSRVTQRLLVGLTLLAAALALDGPLGLNGGVAHPVVLALAAAGALLTLLALAAADGFSRWKVFILGASYFFYGAYSWHFAALLAVSTLANQAFSRGFKRLDREQARKALLFVAVAANLGVLAWFKYRGFFVESASNIFTPLGWHIRPPLFEVLPPVGISFFTFQALSYVIDVYRRKIEPVAMLDFAVYLSFFPHVVAGPIVRAYEFLPQLKERRDSRQVDAGLAFWLIAAGLFKKVVISSFLAAQIADPVFKSPSQHGGFEALLGIYAYAIQIYCDFSGYTDMAIGIALLLGFRFPQNFDAPYSAVSLQDFWRRWHMTLSRWLRDYLYIPLGGNQGSRWKAYRNLFLTMLIGGLWHGAAWTFVAWGALHGGGMAIGRFVEDRRKERADGLRVEVHGREVVEAAVAAPLRFANRLADGVIVCGEAIPEKARPWLKRLWTFHLVCLGWVFFRATSINNAFQVLGRLFHGGGAAIDLMVPVAIVAFIATQYVPPKVVGHWQALFSRLEAWQQAVMLATWLVISNVLGPQGVAPFIYFQF
ncbi:MAG TPA: MBOAT family protein [Acidimicrobiales bacterium]